MWNGDGGSVEGALAGLHVLDLSESVAGPCFAQHNEEVLAELLGLEPERVAELERAGAVVSAPEEVAGT
jgi:hypothetical protein